MLRSKMQHRVSTVMTHQAKWSDRPCKTEDFQKLDLREHHVYPGHHNNEEIQLVPGRVQVSIVTCSTPDYFCPSQLVC